MEAKEYIVEYFKEYNRLFCKNANGELKSNEVDKFIEMRKAVKRVGQDPDYLIPKLPR